MAEPPKNQVSLRGASAKEITREALLEKVSKERELRNYVKCASKAALYIQSVWRRNHTVKVAALQFQEEWLCLVNLFSDTMTKTWISNCLLRPFLFFITSLSTRHQQFRPRDVECMRICFKTLLDSINSTDSVKNFCCLAVGIHEEKKIWFSQVQKLIRLCLFILADHCNSCAGNQDIVIATSLGIRLVVVLTDLKGWKCISNEAMPDACIAVKNLLYFIGSRRSGLYKCIMQYICKLDMSYSSNVNYVTQPDDQLLITASAITVALQPFHILNIHANSVDSLHLLYAAAEQFSVFVLTIPWLTHRVPSVLLPALKHKSILSSCFKTLMISKDKILMEMSNMIQMKIPFPHVGWALANTICLATECVNSSNFGQFTEGLDYGLYVHSVIIFSENLLSCLESVDCKTKGKGEHALSWKVCTKFMDSVMNDIESDHGPLNMPYMNLYLPVCQQWHLSKLLEVAKMDTDIHEPYNSILNFEVKLEILDILYFYSYMLKVFSALNSTVGSLPILNMLSFTPGFLITLWKTLEKLLFMGNDHSKVDICTIKNVDSNNSEVYVKHGILAHKDESSKWNSLIHKITGYPHVGVASVNIKRCQPKTKVVTDNSCDVWDIEAFKHGVQGISKNSSCLLYLFCATYSHMLPVLDDIEFYEKQVPFTLEQQRRIASLLNTLVYNGLCYGSDQKNKLIIDAATRCLLLLYERDCRHQFCPPSLWLSPARESRLPVAIAARTHEVLSANLGLNDIVNTPVGSVIITIPHVFPFEERVQMFREFIKMDKASRRIAGEVSGPGPGSLEIIIRRGHVVEDGFLQLNSLGSRLKSSIYVSFVSECGLPEAGLDYGGLTKEFLTEITKEAFSPEYGLFSQTTSSDGLLIPNTSAKFLENGIQMVEFLGRVVGKALYEGILLDYSFSHVFVQKLLGRYSFLDELSTLDPEVYKNLVFVKHYEGDVKELTLDFTITEDSYGKLRVIELKPGGKDVLVTNENKLQYVHAIADYKLNRQISLLTNAFYRGLADIILPSWLKLFNASEFNQLLSGGDHDIDIMDLKNNTKYTGGYSEVSRSVRLFWEVFAGFESKERCGLLKFVTSCSRGPLLGFKHLQPTFTIHKVACEMPFWAAIGGQDVERLPSASTCYNTLKLPSYKRASTMRAKILYAINSNAGFELS